MNFIIKLNYLFLNFWLFLFYNKIGYIGIKYLGLGLSKLIKLKYLNLKLDYNLNNKIGDEI